MSKPKVLVVNPNSNEATTAMMCRFAQEDLPEFEVVGATAAGGPKMIVEEVALRQSRRYVVAAALRALEADPSIAAVMVAAYGDPGRQMLEDLLDIPVVGIGKSSILEASSGGRVFGIATSTPGLASSIDAMVDSAVGEEHFVGVVLTSSEPAVLAGDPERQFQELKEAVEECARRGAEAVIIGGGPLSEAARRLSDLGIGVIVEPVPAACAKLRKELAS